MIADYINFLPSRKYADVEHLQIDSLCGRDYVQYGYIKKRNIDKFENGDVVGIKMGQLTPTNKTYLGLNILQAVEKRIEEQDSTSCFEDDDELVPIYIFVTEETDLRWRKHLIRKGYGVSRTNKSREGINISKGDLIREYELRYYYLGGYTPKEREKNTEEELIEESLQPIAKDLKNSPTISTIKKAKVVKCKKHRITKIKTN